MSVVVAGNIPLYMESWDVLFDLVVFESSDGIIAGDMDINNPWHAVTRALFKLSPVVANNKFSIEEKALSEKVFQ